MQKIFRLQNPKVSSENPKESKVCKSRKPFDLHRRKTSSLAFQIQQYEDGIFGVSVVHFIVSLNVENCLLHI